MAANSDKQRGMAAWTGGVAPLFDRLVDASPRALAERRPLRSLELDGVVRSIESELRRLLNTRRAVDYGTASGPETVLDYGIPDASALPPHSADEVARLAAAIATAIERFEPRLDEVTVAIDRADPESRSLLAFIGGSVTLRRVTHRVSFTIPLDAATEQNDG